MSLIAGKVKPILPFLYGGKRVGTDHLKVMVSCLSFGSVCCGDIHSLLSSDLYNLRHHSYVHLSYAISMLLLCCWCKRFCHWDKKLTFMANRLVCFESILFTIFIDLCEVSNNGAVLINKLQQQRHDGATFSVLNLHDFTLLSFPAITS